MPKKRRKSFAARTAPAASRRAAEALPEAAVRPTVPEALAIASLAVVLVGTALLVDAGAHASFDAPKRLAATVGAALAAVAAIAFRRPSRRLADAWRALSSPARIALAAGTAALVWSALSAAVSPRRATSLDALRTVFLYLLLVPLGASTAVAKGKNLLAATFLSAAAVNAGISILQSRGVQPFRLETFGTRNLTGALAGNVGYLAIATALAAVLALGIALSARRRPVRGIALAALLLLLAALVVNRNLTGLVSVALGVIVLLVASYGRRSLVPIAAVGIAVAVALVAFPPLRQRATAALAAVRGGDWDLLTTYRTGAWTAALEMTRERPITGWGPGTYAAEFVPHRLQAEIRAQHRFVNPLVTSSYAEAHSDYLQAFAEGGIPGGLAAITAAGALLAGVARKARSRGEAAILLGVLVAGAAAALTWFPLQRPISAVPLLIAAGRAWRIAANGTEASKA